MISIFFNRICGVIVSVLVSSTVDRGFEPQSGQTKDYEIGIYCISAKHTVLRRKCKDWLARNQDNVLEWDNMPIRRQSFTFSELALKILIVYVHHVSYMV